MVKSKNSPTFASKQAQGAYGCKDFDELQNYAASKFIAISDDLRDYHFEGLQNAVDGIELVLAEHPEVTRTLGSIVLTGRVMSMDTYACADFNGTITLNENYWKTWIAYEALGFAYQRDLNNGFHPPGEIKHIASHEAGHLIERTILAREIPNTSKAVYQWNKGTQATQVVKDACTRVKRTEYGKGMRNDELCDEVALYKKKSRGRAETFAECIADYAANGKDAHPVSIEVHNILRDKLR